jgi:hypothetical protein
MIGVLRLVELPSFCLEPSENQGLPKQLQAAAGVSKIVFQQLARLMD